MRRLSRRIWTWGLTGAGILVIVAALVTGLFRVLVLAAPSYRADVEQKVSEIVRRDVTIGEMDLVWSRWRPALDFTSVLLAAQSGNTTGMAIDRVRVELSAGQLIRGNVKVARILVERPTLFVRRTEDGQLLVSGLSNDPDAAPPVPQTLVDGLSKIGRLDIRSARLRIDATATGDETLVLDPINLDLRTGGGKLVARSVAARDGQATERAEVKAELTPAGDHWDGEITLSLIEFDPEFLAERWMHSDASVDGSDLNAEVTAEFTANEVTVVAAKLSVATLEVRSDRHRRLLENIAVDAVARRDDESWRLEVASINAEVNGIGWPDARITAEVRRNAESQLRSLKADATFIRIDDVVPLIAAFIQDGETRSRIPVAGGDLEGMVLRVEQPAEGDSAWSLTGRVSDLSVAPGDKLPGINGINGAIFSDERGGRAELGSGNGTLIAPQLFSRDFPISQLSSHLRWERATDRWRVTADDLILGGLGVEIDGRLGLELPRADIEQSIDPAIDLDLSIRASDLGRLQPFVVRTWKPKLREWLGAAIPQGSIPRGSLRIKSPIKDLRAKPPGTEYLLKLAVSDATLRYAPDWPVISDITADFAIDRHRLSVAAYDGSVGGARIRSATAVIPDLRQPVLSVKGETQGDAAGLLGFLSESPLKKPLKPFLSTVKASGATEVSLNLSRKMKGKQPVNVDARVQLKGINMTWDGLPDDPFRDITGELRVDGKNLMADAVSARFRDVDLLADIEPPNEERSWSRLVATGLIDFDGDDNSATGFMPSWMRSVYYGKANARAELQFGEGAEPGVLLESNLVGVRIAEPAPLDKPDTEAIPTRMRIAARDPGVWLSVSHGDRLSAAVQFGRESGGMSAVSATLNFGPEPVVDVPERGLRVTGSISDLHVSDWTDRIREIVSQPGAGWGFPEIEISTERVHALNQTFENVAMSFTDRGQWVDINLDGEGARGVLRWPYPEQGRALIEADLSYLRWPKPNIQEAEEGEPPMDPSELPGFRVRCSDFRVGEEAFGALEMLVLPEADGLRLDSLVIGGETVNASATGFWARREGLSTGHFEMDLQSADFERVISAMNFEPNLSAKESHIVANLNWSENAEGISWARAEGKLAVSFREGSLLNIDPGAGRMLGLFSFNALPRRFLLDFRDVTEEGMQYDSIDGSFRLRDGSAFTRDLVLNSPSLKIETRGRIGLVDRDYDQEISIYPDASSGLSLAGVLLGGPAVGAFLLLTQELLDKPLDQATQIKYRLKGTWEKPEIVK